MESLPTLIDLLTADLLIPLLPSLVTMATLSLEGGGDRQCQNDGTWSGTTPTCQCEFHYIFFTFLDTVNTVPTEPPTTCPDLTVPANGMISYNMGTASPRPVNTVATYTCDTDYILNGGSTRTCGANGVWSGSAPTCQGELCNSCTAHL